jgi:hypothetical protein
MKLNKKSRWWVINDFLYKIAGRSFPNIEDVNVKGGGSPFCAFYTPSTHLVLCTSLFHKKIASCNKVNPKQI